MVAFARYSALAMKFLHLLPNKISFFRTKDIACVIIKSASVASLNQKGAKGIRCIVLQEVNDCAVPRHAAVVDFVVNMGMRNP